MLHSGAVRDVQSKVRVRYADTDQMGIAHHANYLVWFEIGRTDLCRETGFSYAEIEARGYLLVVSDAGCRYRTPFRYDDEVRIRTFVQEWGSRGLTFGYELYGAAGDLRASGFTSHVWVSRKTRKPVRADEEIAAAFAPFL